MTIWDATYRTMGRPLVIAHRGGMSHARENTLAAFAGARRAGADVIETDLRLTQDGIAICLHDSWLIRGTARQSVAEMAFADVQGFDTEIPSFAEAAALHPALFLDLKEETLERRLTLLDALGAAQAEAGWIAGIDSLEASDAIGAQFPKLRQLALMADREQLAKFARKRPGRWVRIHEPHVSVPLLDGLRREGLRIVITCGGNGRLPGEIEAEGLKRLLAVSPDAVIVNDPIMAIRAVSQAGLPDSIISSFTTER